MLCALIMAGGIGSRFWPSSTPRKPKQFLALINEKTMIQLTYERMNKLIDKDHIFIVTNKEYKDLVKEQIEGIKDENIICEPAGRNTAPCILLSCLYIKNLLGEATIACVSSDSYIEKEELFLNNIKEASNFVNSERKAVVTIGITPTRAETGYGYIKYLKENKLINKVECFVEKPNLEKATEYLESGNYLWNAGIFVFNNMAMLHELETNLSDDYHKLVDLPKVADKNYESFLDERYPNCNKISIDYAVMEKSKDIYTIPSDIGWDDVGTWKSLERYLPEDELHNIKKGNIKVVNSHHNIIYGADKPILLLDVDDIFCIDAKDCLVIGKRDSIKDVHNYREKM